MGFLGKLFSGQSSQSLSYAEFWTWFLLNEKTFFRVIKQGGTAHIESGFFNKLEPKLAEIKDGFYYLVGMLNENTVDFILTADGNLKNIAFVEELVAAAPSIAGWKISAHKPEAKRGDESFGLKMAGYEFSESNLFFYENEHDDYPDEIDITAVHPDLHTDLDEEARRAIGNGVYIFLDNYLGELEFATMVDGFNVLGKDKAQKALRPMTHLKDYLKIRQRQFVEKYQGVRGSVEDDSYAIFEATLQNDMPLIAMMNTKLLAWDAKASHPWLAILKISYDGSNNNGMPSKQDNDLMHEIEDKLSLSLIDKEGYLNVGRETADGLREIYFACKDFRLPSKVYCELVKAYDGKLQLKYEIYKDKYWQSLARFMQD